MILSEQQIEEIGKNIINDFRLVSGIHTDYTAIEQLAKDYLNLEVIYIKLSNNDDFCGLTAYEDTFLCLNHFGEEQIIEVKQNQIILDSSFIEPNKERFLCGKRRFTLAHEISHQILFAMDTDNMLYKNRYSKRQAHTIRQLKTAEDWNEWQANVLGASLLMPLDSIERFRTAFKMNKPLSLYDGQLFRIDKYILQSFCEFFAVSKATAMIRLRKLGLLIDKNNLVEDNE